MTTATSISAAELFRLAPVGEAVPVLRWDTEAIWVPSPSGQWSRVAEGPFVEVAQAPSSGIVFQRVEWESVIWLLSDSGPRELVVADEGQRLRLEGAGVNSDGEPIVYYQRHETGSPETTRSSLRSFNIVTGEVREIIETGAWEAATSFDHLSVGSIAVGSWSSEAVSGNAIVDLSVSSQVIWDQASDGCVDGESGCVAYEHATVVDGRLVGLRPIWNEDEGVVDQFGVFEFDLETGSEELVASFSWDNGLWYVEDMFGDRNRVILSLSDSSNDVGNPLPALVVELTTGDVSTLPDAGFVRPAHLP